MFQDGDSRWSSPRRVLALQPWVSASWKTKPVEKSESKWKGRVVPWATRYPILTATSGRSSSVATVGVTWPTNPKRHPRSRIRCPPIGSWIAQSSREALQLPNSNVSQHVVPTPLLCSYCSVLYCDDVGMYVSVINQVPL